MINHFLGTHNGVGTDGREGPVIRQSSRVVITPDWVKPVADYISSPTFLTNRLVLRHQRTLDAAEAEGIQELRLQFVAADAGASKE